MKSRFTNCLLIACIMCVSRLLAQEAGTITGTVTDEETGEGLPGVTVLVKNSSVGTTTDIDGKYSISFQNEDRFLVFSFVGYKNQEIGILGRNKIDVELTASLTSLDEIVVVGYGTQRKQDLTGAISSIRSEIIENQPAASVDNLLQGRAAGVQISQSSGAPGGRVSIRIRGASSINAGNEPLIVIDGVPLYNSSKDPGGSSYGTFSSTNAMASLNPNDIESIQILKDASATAIYGSRGSNGVMIITTKRGKGKRVNINYNSYYGTQEVVRKLDIMNGVQHAEFLNDWAAANNLPEPFSDPLSIGEGTDWQDEIFREAPIQNHQISLSSNNGDSKYYISANYFDQKGIVINSGIKRYSLRVNVDRAIRERFKFSQSLTYNRTLNRSVPISNVGAGNIRSPAQMAYVVSPTIPVFNNDGTYVKDWYGSNKPQNPIEALNSIHSQVTGDNLLGNMSLDYEIIDGLTLKTMVGINLYNRFNEEYYPMETTYIGGILEGLGSLSSRRITNILNENTLRYSNVINKVHTIEILGGFTWQTENSFSSRAQPTGFPDDRLGINSIAGATGVPTVTSGKNEWSLASVLGRINYQYNNKYLVTATIRADGSSRFGIGNKWGYFPSVALGYRLSEEGFFSGVDLIEDLKIRASYGVTGNQEIGSYQSLARLVTSAVYIFDDQLVSGARQSSLANNNLRWEKSTQIDIGLDLSIFNGRLNVIADYYVKNTEDLLFRVNLPAYSGYSSALSNTGELRNKGVELTVNGDILEGNFQWNTGLNFSHNRPEIISLGESGSTSLFVGHAPGTYLGYIYDGVFHTQEEIDAQTVQTSVVPGDLRYKDINGDGIFDADDRDIIGNPIPDFIYGFNNTLSYKGFSFNVFLMGEVGANARRLGVIYNPNSVSSNKSVDLVNRWTPTNTSSDIPRAGASNLYSPSTYDLEDISYIKIRNIQLGYDIPIEKVVRSVNVYLAGQNLWTFTDYSGYDPEGGNNYPIARTIMLGLNVSF